MFQVGRLGPDGFAGGVPLSERAAGDQLAEQLDVFQGKVNAIDAGAPQSEKQLRGLLQELAAQLHRSVEFLVRVRIPDGFQQGRCSPSHVGVPEAVLTFSRLMLSLLVQTAVAV